MAESRVPQVIDALVAKAGALAGYRLASATTIGIADVVTVWDGPEFRTSDDSGGGGHLVIGWSGNDPDALSPAASTALEAGPMVATARPRDELGFVIGRAIVDRAETPKAARDAAHKILSDLATLCRADPSLGIQTSDTIGGVITRTYLTAGDMYQYLRNGNSCEWEFTVTFRSRV